jgi:uncharacterized repeat protein (TIGR03843 family)
LALLVGDGQSRYIYKPITGERELWDFESGTLALREVAAYRLSELLGWHFVPRTFLADGPNGVGSFQEWVSHSDTYLVDVFATNEVPENYLPVVDGFNEANQPVTLSHANDDELARIAVFDALINNADRKAGHILVGERLWAIDHGVAFHEEPKLRTVLWGWANQAIPNDFLTALERLNAVGLTEHFADLLSPKEIAALAERHEALLSEQQFPVPSQDWPAIPWPIF